ncbi:probable Xaa-Pro aminopeptidase 3 isoform X2 [Mizuhopecten yessoensis]|uniref:probable Xaa-Pro aminopeptidase 3 isoform X1 n=1 Tax=Mizuhopecten yessoensis TaxID=6573 RepID=UPI000B459F15|nr:probable Xaa-Pro aminopeptidase 3 isoform X1 [Mizuhopecten yessoensis]XP_021348314.1 probable Xaa-Pro aminopeptidase 3 isoform X2 [Mizuhopecten yessoensis]
MGCCNALRTFSRLFRLNQPLTILHRNFGQPVAQTHPHLLKQGEVTPFVTKEEYSNRRHNVFKLALDQFEGCNNVKEHIMIFPSASRLYMTIPIPYPFRQNTDFLYLSGFQEADSVLILHNSQNVPVSNSTPNSTPNSRSGMTSVLFVPRKDPYAELWEGERSGREGAEEITGVDGAYNTEDLRHFLQDYSKEHSDYVIWYDAEGKVHPQLHGAGIEDFILQGKQKCVETTTQKIHQTRVIKSPAEAQLMLKSVDIASESLEEVMRFSYPMVNESYLHAKMEYECKLRDAQMLAYPPVVAGGHRGNTIHYTKNNQIVSEGEMVLMDAGCEYHGFCSDLTRTWPVSGRFSPVQRRLYEMVLRIQLKVISLCTPQFSLEQIYVYMLHLLGDELVSLGLMKPKDKTTDFFQELRAFYPHHVGHYLGMDVHDTPTMSRYTKLQPGMIIAIEPGVYIPKDRTTVPEEYRGIAIRIEDNLLITDSEPIVLSANCVKDPDHIEEIMASKS